MSGSSTKREPPAKLTSGLLARKGQARPADLLDGDSLLVTAQNRPPLTLIRRDEPAITGLFDDDEAVQQPETTLESGSLLNFSLARPGSGEPPETETQMLAEPLAPGRPTTAPELDAAAIDTDTPRSSSSAPTASAAESQQAPTGVEAEKKVEAAGPFRGESPRAAADEADTAPAEPVDSNLPRVLILAALLVISFAVGLWIVSWINQSPPAGVKNVNLPVEIGPANQVESAAEIPSLSGDSAQGASTRPLAPSSPAGETEPEGQLRPITEELGAALAGTETPGGSVPNVAQDEGLDPQVPPAPRLPAIAAESLSVTDEKPLSAGDGTKTIAPPDLEANTPELEAKQATPDQGAVLVTPKPNPKYAQTATAVRTNGPGYVVQLLAGRDLKTVTWEKDRLLRRFPQVAGPGPLEVKKVEGQRVFYRVRTSPFDDAASARALCRALKQENQDCLVLKQ